MTKQSNYYRDTPVGQQMAVFLNQRTKVRHATPLFPRSFLSLLGICKSGRGQQMTGKGDDKDSSSHRRVAHI